MYYNYEEEKFKAVLFNFFLFEYSLEFHMKDVYMPDIPGVFSTLKLKNNSGRSIFVDIYGYFFHKELICEVLFTL